MAGTEDGPRERGARTLSILFAAALSLPSVGMLFPVRDAPGPEAALAPAPRLGLDRESLVALPGAFKRYVQDRFAFRTTLLAWLGAFKLRCLGVSASRQVIVGRDGWLFYADEASRRSLRHSRPFSEEQLDDRQRELEQRSELLARNGIRFLFVIAPDKHTVYPEHVPASWSRVHEGSSREQLVERLRTRSNVAVLDLTDTLRGAKGWGDLYYRVDTHWNQLAGFAAYQAIGRQLAGWFPSLRPRSRSELDLVPGERRGDLARLLGLGDRMAQDDPTLVPRIPSAVRSVPPGSVDVLAGIDLTVVNADVKERDGAELESAVVLCDSFGAALEPFLSEHFGRTIYLGGSYLAVPLERIVKMRPRVVIQEAVERTLQ